MFRNKKGHIDPICVIPFTLVALVGFFIMWTMLSGGTPQTEHVLAFASLSIVSVFVHLFHHGVNPVDIMCSIIIFVIAIFLIRFSLGNVDAAGEFYYDNLQYIIPTIVLLDGIKTVV